MEFIEAPLFTKMLPDYLGDDEYRELQLYLTVQPEAGEVIPGTGGFRKLRWADQRRTRQPISAQGRRGSSRRRSSTGPGSVRVGDGRGGVSRWPRGQNGPGERRDGTCSRS